MPLTADALDLDRLRLVPGSAWRDEVFVTASRFTFSGQDYDPADSPLPVNVDVSRTTTGFVMRVRFDAAVEGMCMRCSDDQAFAVTIDQTEIHEPVVDEELASDFVSPEGIFDLAAYVHTAIGLALPQTMSGARGAAGSCALCDRTPAQLRELGIDAAAAEASGDPRWAKLRELEL